MRADAIEKRRDVLAAAWRLFSEQGGATSLRAVATEADVGIGTLYRHFPTRDDLLLGLIDEAWTRIGEIAERHRDPWTDPAQEWSRFVHELADLGIGALAYQVAPMAEESPTLAAATTHARPKAMQRAEQILAEPLGRARDAGLLDPAVDLAMFFVGLAAITRPLPERLRHDLPRQQTWLVDTYIRGLRPVE